LRLVLLLVLLLLLFLPRFLLLLNPVNILTKI
jgi:hypothetical protein